MFFLTVAVTRGLFASKGVFHHMNETVPDGVFHCVNETMPAGVFDGVFHSAVVIERVSNETIPMYQKDCEVPAVYVGDGLMPMITDEPCDRLLAPMFEPDLGSLDAVGFSALDAALGVNDPATGKLFNAPTSVVGSLGRKNFYDAYAEVEKHNLRVARVFMNSRDYYRDIHYNRDIDKTGARRGVVARLWGADIVLSDAVAEGTVYVCADKEHLGAMPMRGRSVGIVIHNPRGVSSIKVVRNH